MKYNARLSVKRNAWKYVHPKKESLKKSYFQKKEALFSDVSTVCHDPQTGV